jgi:hypothetical protein
LLYEHQGRQVKATREKGLKSIERIAYVYGDVFKADKSVMLNICAALFGGVGEQMQDIDRNALCLTTNGICSVTGPLYRYAGKSAQKGDIRPVPGTAEYRGRLYDYVIGYESFEQDMQATLTLADRKIKFEVVEPGKPDEALRIKARATPVVAS